jgi:hypothetical protein
MFSLITRSWSSTRITTYSNKSINEICLLSFSSSMTRSIDTCSDLCFEDFYSQIFLLLSFFFSLRHSSFILRCLSCFLCFFHRTIVNNSRLHWQFWLQSKHQYYHFIQFVKLIFYITLYSIIRSIHQFDSCRNSSETYFETLFNFLSANRKKTLHSRIEHWIIDHLKQSFVHCWRKSRIMQSD